MLHLAIIARKRLTAQGIRDVAAESGIFVTVYDAPPTAPQGEILRTLKAQQPDLVLLDVNDWSNAEVLAKEIRSSSLQGVVIGFAEKWTAADQVNFTAAGVEEILPEPFSSDQLQACTYDALHKKGPGSNQGMVAFLPAKAGSGSTTVALNTAAALAQLHPKKVLLIEADRRSGALSMMLDLPNRAGLAELLKEADHLTSLAWTNGCHQLGPLDVVASNPFRRSDPPSWADYFQLLNFARQRYQHIVVDLPEVVNPATAELVRQASSIFIVCTPELPSLSMASLRSEELKECAIAEERVRIVLNRFEKRRMSVQDAEATLNRRLYATIPNDYREVRNAITESRTVSQDSRIWEACVELAERINDHDDTMLEPSRFSLFRKLHLLAG